MRVSPAMRCGRKTDAWCMAMLVAAWVIFLMSCGVGQCLACVLHYMYTHSRHMCAWDFLLCCLCVATCCIFVYVYTFVNTQRMSILSPASLRHSIRYIGYTMRRTAGNKTKRDAWSGDLRTCRLHCVRDTKTLTGQHWHCSRCKAENTGSHDWWRDQNNDTDENQVWLCVKCQQELYGWLTFTGGREPLMEKLLEERAAQTRLAEQGEPGGSTCSTHTLPVGTTPSSHVPTTQTTGMDEDMGVE